MTDTVSGIILLVLAAAAFNNYRRGTLPQWLAAKFFNAAAPAGAGQRLVGSSSTPPEGASAWSLGTSTSELETWRGITLNKAAMASFKVMAAAASVDGISLTGGGYRTNAQQIALRIAHGCAGARIYDSSCKGSPPTAVPGKSLHESGHAIDMDNCRTRSTRVFQWLDANAGRHGWKNLPSEPWHWSWGPRAGQ